MALFFTFVTGVFFVLGILLNVIFKGNKNISILSIALAFAIIINLIFIDILPEIYDQITFNKIIFIVLGFLILKIMDIFIPHHQHNHVEHNDDEHDHNHHLHHISVMTVFALSLHNIIECMALYNVSIKSADSGFLMCLAIGLHNLPLGFQIGTNLKENKLLYIILFVLSGILGGLISLNIGVVSEVYTTYILCFSLGMLIYLAFCELFKEIIVQIKNVYTYYGIIVAIILIVVSSLI